MPVTLTETAALVADQTFLKRAAAGFVRHAAFLLQRSDEQLTASHRAWTAAGVRQAAADIVRNSNRAEHRERWAFLVCAVPAMTATATDTVLGTSVETAFPSLINPVDRSA